MAPNATYLWTDNLGRMFSRVQFGWGLVLLFIGLIAAVIDLIGVLWGATAGRSGGRGTMS